MERVYRYPPTVGDGEDKTLPSLRDVVEQCVAESIDGGSIRIEIAEGQHILGESVSIKLNSLNVAFEGMGPGVMLVASGHSAFDVRGRKSRVSLKNLGIVHTQFSSDKREIGACVFALHQAVIDINNCKLTSHHGFALWVIQRAAVTVHSGSDLTSLKRSCCVCFGDSRLTMTDALVADAGQHGVCCRGRVALRMRGCIIRNCGVRALYAYQHTDVSLVDCDIQGTKSSEQSAIDVRCDVVGPSQRLLFELSNCRIHDNKGLGLRIRGHANSIVWTLDQCTNADGESIELIEDALACCDDDGMNDAGESDGEEKHGGESGEKSSYESGAVVWQWCADDPKDVLQKVGQWRSYPPAVSKAIEAVFCRLNETDTGSRVVSADNQNEVSIDNLYTVNIANMEQTNVKSLHSRSIRRRV